MKSNELILKCYAEYKDSCWQAFCLDFDLAVQSETFEDARKKLQDAVSDYVYDALAGEDKEHAQALLRRRAPYRMYLKFYYIALCDRLDKAKDGLKKCLINEPMPLAPQDRHRHA